MPSSTRLSLVEVARLAADCLEIAGRGAAVALGGYGARASAAEKSANDLVTEFDVATQALVIELLSARFPGVPVIGEESDRASLAEHDAELVFAVDPIDGTTNFSLGHPFWCVSIGALSHGQPLAGAVVAPSLALAWHGYVHEEGAGLYKNGAPRAVSATESLAHSVLATGFPPLRDQAPANNFDSFMAVKRAARAVRRCGSAALDLCFVADGTYDGYWERRLHLWDAAAGAAFVLAGGGRVSALDGGPARLERGHIVASNGRIHEQLVRAIAS